jgi:hypothetical protein
MSHSNKYILPLSNTLTVLLALFMNFLAVTMPLNNKTTGELSDAYPNFFVPAGFTFAIWGIIYLQLLVFTIFQWYGVWKPTSETNNVVQKAGYWFCLSSLANAAWIIAWHYEAMVLSMIIMLALFYALRQAYLRISELRPLQTINSALILLMFSVYFGWISVATIANATALLVSVGFTVGFLAAPVWAAVLIAVAGILATFMIYRKQDIGYAAVIVWAAYGIYARHAAGGDYTSPVVATTAKYIMVFLIIYMLLNLIGKKWYLFEKQADRALQ